jgi:hypothetical protein
MKKLPGSKSFLLLLGLVTLLAVLYLAAGISSLKFKPAQSFSFVLPAIHKPNPPAAVAPSDLWITLLTGILAVLFIAAVLSAVINRDQRKKLLNALLRLAVLIAVMLLIRATFRVAPAAFDTQAIMASPPLPGNNRAGQGITPPPFIPPQLPAWEIYLLSLASLLAVGGGIWWLLWLTRKNRSPRALADFEHIARATLDEIEAGDGWEDAIVRCYVRMSRAVNLRRSLARQAAMTPTEFSAQLQVAGLPSEAVRRLTLLFERVRYGAKSSSQADIVEAVDCLTAILQACQETA